MLSLIYLLMIVGSLGISKGQSFSYPPPPVNCPLITLYQALPPNLKGVMKDSTEATPPIKKYLRKYTYTNFTIVSLFQHNPSTEENSKNVNDLCKWWLVSYPQVLNEGISVAQAMERTISIYMENPIAFFISNVNEFAKPIVTIDDLITKIITMYRQAAANSATTSNNTMSPIKQFVINTYSTGQVMDAVLLNFKRQLERRYGDLPFLNILTNPDLDATLAGMQTNPSFFSSSPSVIGFIASISFNVVPLFKAIAITGDQTTDIAPDVLPFVHQDYKLRSESRIAWVYSQLTVDRNKDTIGAMKLWAAGLLDRVVRDAEFGNDMRTLGFLPNYLSATKPDRLQKYFQSAIADIHTINNEKPPLKPGDSVSIDLSSQRIILVVLLSVLSLFVTAILLETIRSELKQLNKLKELREIRSNKRLFRRRANSSNKEGTEKEKDEKAMDSTESMKRKEELLKRQLPHFFRKHPFIHSLVPSFLTFISSALLMIAGFWGHAFADISSASYREIEESNRSDNRSVPNELSSNTLSLFISWTISFPIIFIGLQLIIHQSVSDEFFHWNRRIRKRFNKFFDDAIEQTGVASVFIYHTHKYGYRDSSTIDSRTSMEPSVMSSITSVDSNVNSDSDGAINIDDNNQENINNMTNTNTLSIIFHWKFLLGGLFIGAGYIVILEFIYSSIFFPYVEYSRDLSKQASSIAFGLVSFGLISFTLIVQCSFFFRFLFCSVLSAIIFITHYLSTRSYHSSYQLYYDMVARTYRTYSSNQLFTNDSSSIASSTIDIIVLSIASLLIIFFMVINVLLLRLSRSALDQGVITLMKNLSNKTKQNQILEAYLRESEALHDLKNRLQLFISYSRPIPNPFNEQELQSLLRHDKSQQLFYTTSNHNKTTTNGDKNANTTNNSLDNNNVFDDLFLHPLTIELLKDWSHESHCEENILFLLSIQRWKANYLGVNLLKSGGGRSVGSETKKEDLIMNDEGKGESVPINIRSLLQVNYGNGNSSFSNIIINKTRSQRMVSEAVKIFESFIDTNAPHQINISHSQRLRIINFMTNNTLISTIPRKESTFDRNNDSSGPGAETEGNNNNTNTNNNPPNLSINISSSITNPLASLYDESIIEVHKMLQSQSTAFKASSHYSLIQKILSSSTISSSGPQRHASISEDLPQSRLTIPLGITNITINPSLPIGQNHSRSVDLSNSTGTFNVIVQKKGNYNGSGTPLTSQCLSPSRTDVHISQMHAQTRRTSMPLTVNLPSSSIS